MSDDVDVAPRCIAAAQERIRARLDRTPLIAFGQATTSGGAPILLKVESVQPTGSFKVRGALNKIGSLTPAERVAGVLAYSTGNHAQAVAWAARESGIAATVVMSPDAPRAKVDATLRLGAEVIMAEAGSDARRELAEQLAADRGSALVPPYDDLDVIAGQATVATEILEQSGDAPPATIYVPIGGGGLIAGIAAATKQRCPGTRIVGVEPDSEADAWRSFRDGVLHRLDGPSDSVADAIRVQQLGRLTWPLIRRYVDDIVTVSEAAIIAACRAVVDGAHVVVEPGGVVGVAAALDDGGGPAGGPVVAVGAGGNIELTRLAALAATDKRQS